MRINSIDDMLDNVEYALCIIDIPDLYYEQAIYTTKQEAKEYGNQMYNLWKDTYTGSSLCSYFSYYRVSKEELK